MLVLGLLEACGSLELLGKAVSMQEVNHHRWWGSLAGSKRSQEALECSKNHSRLQVLREAKRGLTFGAAAPEHFGLWRLVAALPAGDMR